MTDTARLLALLEAATPRPWEARHVQGGMPADVCSYGVVSEPKGHETLRCWEPQDAALIAEAVNALPGLIAENARLRAALEAVLRMSAKDLPEEFVIAKMAQIAQEALNAKG